MPVLTNIGSATHPTIRVNIPYSKVYHGPLINRLENETQRPVLLFVPDEDHFDIRVNANAAAAQLKIIEDFFADKVQTRIALVDCKHGYLYRLRSRNLRHGVFNQERNGFIGIRTKFTNRFLDLELHWSYDSQYGTASPLEELQPCPVKDLRRSGDLLCKICKRKAETAYTPEGVFCGYYHADDDSPSCEKYEVAHYENKELFHWLDENTKYRE